MTNLKLNKTIAAATVGAMALLAPLSANALTVQITDTFSGSSVTLVDGVDDAFADGVLAYAAQPLGASYVSLTAAIASEGPGVSTLNLNVNADAGSDGLLISAWDETFGAASQSPATSSVSFTFNASALSGGTVDGSGSVWDGVNPALVLGPSTLTSTADNVAMTGAVVVDNPYSMQIDTAVSGGASTSFDATLVAAIPLPAGGLLLLTALGGLGLARRRRKAA